MLFRFCEIGWGKLEDPNFSVGTESFDVWWILMGLLFYNFGFMAPKLTCGQRVFYNHFLSYSYNILFIQYLFFRRIEIFKSVGVQSIIFFVQNVVYSLKNSSFIGIIDEPFLWIISLKKKSILIGKWITKFSISAILNGWLFKYSLLQFHVRTSLKSSITIA